jgi:uncharacterized RDD family membrane protein YckC
MPLATRKSTCSTSNMEEHKEILPSGDVSREGERCAACGQVNADSVETCAKCGQRLLPVVIRRTSDLPPIGFPRLDSTQATDTPADAPSQDAANAHISADETANREGGAGQEAQVDGPVAGPKHVDETDVKYYFGPSYPGILLQPAGLFRRAAATALDWVLINLLAMLVLYAAGWGTQLNELNQLAYSQGLAAFSTDTLPPDLATAATILTFLTIGLAIGLYAIFIAYGGATPGMRLLRIQVCRSDGADVGLGTALLRAAVLWLFIFFTAGFYLIIAGLSVLIDPKGRAVHDHLTNTNVFLK